MAVGVVFGAALAVAYLDGGATPPISPATRQAIEAMGFAAPSGLVPREALSWAALPTIRGLVSIVGGGLLVGFGSAYAGGCTSGHGIMGLAALQLASVVALVAIFVGGLVATLLILPHL